MSFTGEIKTELCDIPFQGDCCVLAEAMGVLLFARQFSLSQLRMQSQNAVVRRRLEALFHRVFGLELLSEGDSTLFINQETNLQKIFQRMGYPYSSAPLHLNRAAVEEDCDKSAFLRGAFLMGGYVSLSESGYHLELVTSHFSVAREMQTLLLDMDMPCGFVQRRGNFVLYYKDSGAIEDFLTAAGASGSAMELMLRKVEKDLRNRVNRKVNCETANLEKTVEASSKQVAAIERLRRSEVWGELPDALRETADIRLEHPELSLSEMCLLFNPPLSRSGLNNRMKKLMKLAEELT